MIEFRGKRINCGEWVYGYFTKEAGSCFIEMPFDFADNQTFCVRPETVGQYALAQPNGVKIFTGDILSKKWRAEVYQDNATGAFMVRVHGMSGKPQMTLRSYFNAVNNAYEDVPHRQVIGNIHDNPELLEGKI